MSAESRLELALIKLGQPASDEWHGSLDETWDNIVSKNPQYCDEKRTFTDAPGFVYLWRVEIFDNVFHKVGYTRNLDQRFKKFCAEVIPAAKCTIEKSQKLPNPRVAESRERRFIVACRDFCLGGEWFVFEAPSVPSSDAV